MIIKRFIRPIFSVILSFIIIFGVSGLNTTKSDALASYRKKTSYLQVKNPTRHRAQIKITVGKATTGWKTVQAGKNLGAHFNNINKSARAKIEFRNSGNSLSPVYEAKPGYVTIKRGVNHYVTPKTKTYIDLFNKYVNTVY